MDKVYTIIRYDSYDLDEQFLVLGYYFTDLDEATEEVDKLQNNLPFLSNSFYKAVELIPYKKNKQEEN